VGFDEVNGVLDLLDNLPMELLPEVLGSPGFRATGIGNILQLALVPMYFQSIEQQMLAEAIQESMAESQPRPQPPKKVALHDHKVSMAEFRERLECPVCLSQFGYKERGIVRLKCDHVFHRACLEPWFRENHTCPMCRADVDEG